MSLSFSAVRDDLRHRGFRERAPMACLFEITPTCNLRCHFCYVALDPYKGPYLTTQQVFQVLDRLHQAGVLMLTLTGGEILSRRDFPEIYRYAWEKGFLVTLFTNATMVNEKHIELLKEMQPDCVDVTIYGADAEHYEGTTGIKGSFARFERGIDLLREAGIRLSVKHTASTTSGDHFDAVREWAEARALPIRISTALDHRHDGGTQPMLYRLEARRTVELKDRIFEARKGHKRESAPLPECSMGERLPNGEERLYRCGAGRISLFVDALGNASHCVLDREPSFPILDMEWEEVWAAIGEWVNQPLPKEAPCSGCSLRDGCHNCPARSRMSTGSPYLKDTFYCDITHLEYGLEPASHPDYRNLAKRPLAACAS